MDLLTITIFGYILTTCGDISLISTTLLIDMNDIKQVKETITPLIQRPQASTLTVEERLKILANFLIDKFIEDKQKGKVNPQT
jgi:hypothetical protein